MPRKTKTKPNKKEIKSQGNFMIDPVDIVFGDHVILSNTKLTIVHGEHYALVGKNGIGKTSLLNAIAYKTLSVPDDLDTVYVRQEEPESELTVLESLLSSNTVLSNVNCRFNELDLIMNSDAEISDELIEEYDTLSRQIGDYYKAKVSAQKILVGLGFDVYDQLKPVSQFSGGWRMRISLAKALFMVPSLLILDEPTNHLDLHANIWLTSYLKTYPKTLLVVSHDKYFIDETCTTIIHIYDKKLFYYRGNYDQFLQQLHQTECKIKKDWDAYEKKIAAMKRALKTQAEIDAFIKKTVITKPEKDYKVKINFLEPAIIKDKLIQLEQISFSYNDTIIFSDINLEITTGSIMAIVGKNGVGKSTLLKLIVGDLVPTSGIIIRSNVLRIGYYNQHFESSLPMDLTGIEYLMQLNNEINLTLAHKYLSLFGLEPINHNVKISILSGGQKARVKFASFGVSKPHLLILDEPSNHLDIDTITSLIYALSNFKGAIILVSHNFDIITNIKSELWTIADGKLDKYNGDYCDYVDQIQEEIDQ